MAMLNEHFLRLFNLYRWSATHKLLSSASSRHVPAFSNQTLRAELFVLQMSANR